MAEGLATWAAERGCVVDEAAEGDETDCIDGSFDCDDAAAGVGDCAATAEAAAAE
jgi:hypothetical protein